MGEENIFQKNSLVDIQNELLSIKEFFLLNQNVSNQKLNLLSEELIELRMILMPLIIKATGLNKCIQQLIKKMNTEGPFYINLHNSYIDNSLSQSTEINIYAIIEEALSNVKKHANAKSASVNIIPSEKTLLIQITDTGKGFDVMQILKSGKAKGLLNIEKRCMEMETSTSIQSESGNTSISIEIPFKHV